MKKLSIIKGASTFMTSVGVGSIVSNAVKVVAPIATMNPIMKVCVMVGSFALSTMISDKTSKYMEEQIDECAKLANDILKIADEEEDSEECNEKPIKDSQSDFQKFRENCLKDCVNAYKPFKEDDENGKS